MRSSTSAAPAEACDEIPEDHSMIALRVARRVDERDCSFSRLAPKVRNALIMLVELSAVSAAEVTPPRGVSVEPSPKAIRWREVPEPELYPGRRPPQAARPETVHENPLSIVW